MYKNYNINQLVLPLNLEGRLYNQLEQKIK